MIGSDKYRLSTAGHKLYNAVVAKIDKSKYQYLVNPCAEQVLHARGGYCVLSSIVPFFCDTLNEVKQVGALAARFLIRVNMMDSLYKDEVIRTNRIGVGMTGIHEFAIKFFNYSFYDLINESKSQDFWNFIAELRDYIEQAAYDYCDENNLNRPHTITTLKPDGSIAKLFGLTEGGHLAAHRFYLRWVQFQNNDPLLERYRNEGYPVKELVTYPNVSIVGFPNIPVITSLDPTKVVTATEASPEDQYQYLMLLEKYWLGEGRNSQLSYTMKFEKDKYSLEDFRETLLKYQSKIRCCSVMPTASDNEMKSIYEYLPEEEISQEEFNAIMNKINKQTDQAFTKEELQCASGSCPL